MPTVITAPSQRTVVSVSASSGASGPSQTGASVTHGTPTGATNPGVGSGAGQIQKIFAGRLTITNSGTPLSQDLTALVDPAGNALNFTGGTLKYIYATAVSTTAGEDVSVGGGTNGVLAAASPLVIRAKGGELKWQDFQVGITIDATHKILTWATAAGTNVSVDVELWGV